jgi:lysine-specific demethylase 8
MKYGQSTSQAVPRIRYPALTGFYSDCCAANLPAVITGVPEHHALEIFRFSPEFLVRALGDREFPVISTETDFISYERDTLKMQFHEFVERAFRENGSGPKYYFKNSTKLLPANLDDSSGITGLAPFFAKSVVKNLWVSYGSLTAGMHFDAAENLNIQIRGRKRFMLYPPGTSPYYPCPMFSHAANISRVFRDGPQLDRIKYPKFDESTVREVILEEGEILYLPAYWWHQVTSLGDVNINVNTFSIPTVGKQLSHWNQALRGHYQVLLRLLAYGNMTQVPVQTQRRS